MPLYTYQCLNCDRTFEAFSTIDDRKFSECAGCESIAELTIGRPAAVHDFALGWFEHLAHEPIYIKSRKQLKEECNRRGCYAPGILW